MRGAVTYGHNPRIASERIASVTVGISIAEPYDPAEHGKSRKRVIETDQGDHQDKVMDCLVSRGERVVPGDVRLRTYCPVFVNQGQVDNRVYSTQVTKVKYVDHPCKSDAHRRLSCSSGWVRTRSESGGGDFLW
jgi:hypothetical protein